MNKYCPNCKMNFSELFEECPYCENELIIQELNVSEIIKPNIFKMTDEELLTQYKDYLESIRQQGCKITNKEFVDGLREGEKDVYRNTDTTTFEKQLSPIITCPYCKSTDCKKISGLSKAGSVVLWGIFALGKTTKQWHCNNCGSDF